MTDSIGPEKYRDFDEKIPNKYMQYDEIRDYMNDRYAHVAPQRFIDDVAKGVSERREAGGGDLVDMAEEADGVYDPNTGRFRDTETNQFISEDDV